MHYLQGAEVAESRPRGYNVSTTVPPHEAPTSAAPTSLGSRATCAAFVVYASRAFLSAPGNDGPWFCSQNPPTRRTRQPEAFSQVAGLTTYSRPPVERGNRLSSTTPLFRPGNRRTFVASCHAIPTYLARVGASLSRRTRNAAHTRRAGSDALVVVSRPDVLPFGHAGGQGFTGVGALFVPSSEVCAPW